MKKKILDIAWWGRRILTAVLAGVIVLVASGQGQAADTYSESDVELIAKTVWQEARGIERKAEQAAVVWCILNRVDDDRWGDSIAEVVTAPHQFAYDAGAPVTDELRRLAEDVLERWKREKEGETEVGRVLPAGYVFFDGDGSHNHFRREYEHTGEYWEFEAESPYGEERG